jgi:predicted outer membrane repeat protein
MKHFISLCLFLLLTTGALLGQATHFVRGNATGTGDGTSWANAFTDLNLALAAAQNGDQIWVASGVYRTGTNNMPANTFALPTGIKLYGGFAGTETQLSQRNWTTNATRLTGDQAGNDVVDNFALSTRSDNSHHVVSVIVGGSTAPAVLDGFIISNGHTDTIAAAPGVNRAGGGVLLGAVATIRNCAFEQHYGESGACIFGNGALISNTVIDNCTFSTSVARARAPGIYLLNTNGIDINRCTFQDFANVNRGMIYPRTSDNIRIDSCIFRNSTGAGFGTGIFNWQASGTFSNCTFSNLTSGNAAGIYNDNRDGGDFVLMQNCTFSDLFATDYGGTAIYNGQMNHKIENCLFENNEAPSSGAAIYNSDNVNFEVVNSIIRGSKGNYASGVANYGAQGVFENCVFEQNNATNGGAAASNGFKGNVKYKNCTFNENTAAFGGAIFTQNDTTRLEIEGCTFFANTVEGEGGALFVNGNIATKITGSDFVGNSAEIGGAIYARQDSTLILTNTKFRENLVLGQAGAMYILNKEVVATNCLFSANLNLSADMGGGAVSVDAGSPLGAKFTAYNCTFAENSAPIGGGLIQWETDTTSSEAYLHNCLFHNPNGNVNYTAEAGTPTLVSLNGNQSGDNSFEGLLTGTKDLHNVAASFVNTMPPDYNFHLTGGVAVDGGTFEAGLTPTTDLDGLARVGLPDVGCYEFGTSSVFGPAPQFKVLSAMPNPTVDAVMVSVEADWSGNALLEVIGKAGAVVRSVSIDKAPGFWSYRLDLQDLPAGLYRVKLTHPDAAYHTLISKM